MSDSKIFVDPRALRLLPSEWGAECVSLIQNFFEAVLDAIKEKRETDALCFLSALHEPNETRFGLSRKKARGRGMAKKLANKLKKALDESEAAKSGLLVDLEDMALMVPNIASDIISDITTNIIREPLIRYTQETCEEYDIPLAKQVSSGPTWDPDTLRWLPSHYERLPVIGGEKLLLVPKTIVRRKLEYDQDEYFRHFILEDLRGRELASSNSELVYLLKDGTPMITKKSLIAKYGSGKDAIVILTKAHPEVLAKYRKQKEKYISPPLTHEEMAEMEGTARPDWDRLLKAVTSAVKDLMVALFHPHLTSPRSEVKINDGRKRIDVTFTNMAEKGFFAWLAQHYAAPHVFVEYKNYGREIGNPELDQMLGRFSPSRGEFGIVAAAASRIGKPAISAVKMSSMTIASTFWCWTMLT